MVGKLAAAVLMLNWLTASASWSAEADLGNRAAANGFSVLQIATTEPDKLMADWLTPVAGVQVANAKAVRRNQPIVTFVLFFGCRADAAGNCNVTADFETYAPTGALYDRTVGTKIWVARPAPKANQVQLSEGALGIRIEDKDPLGRYTVKTTVNDHVAGIALHTSQDFTAGP
jgi:hypothetical protein